MPEVRLRRWRFSDVDDVAMMADDEQDRHWSTMGLDLEAWMKREIAEERGATRAICLPGNDRAIGRVALRLPEFASEAVRCEAVRESDLPAGELSYWVVPQARGRGIALAAVREMMVSVVPETGLRSVVLDIEEDNVPSLRIAQRLGAERRDPTRVKVDRGGTPRTLVVHVLAVR
jgi:[ribosomal protein S5]-alanine N-acetyltransferase